MRCPVCGSKSVGKVGQDQYYCWECFREYQLKGNVLKIYSVSEDGNLVNYEEQVQLG